ncbi:MAG: aspartate aminotransferase family protein [Blastocatellia bacterium]
MKTETTLDPIIATEEEYQVATYKKFPFVVERGSDVWVFTTDGDRYLDRYGGHAVCSTGHCHPMVVAAIKKQAERLIFYSNLVYSDVRARAVEKLVKAAPPLLSKAFFVNSGTEANEAAMSIARRLTGRTRVISFEGGFHGRTPGSVSACGLPKYQKGIAPLLDDHVLAPWDDIDVLTRMIGQDTAAVILEPIQSMAGVRMGSLNFYHGLRELCDKAGTMLIYDEVQTGMGRTGEFFFSGRNGITPDMATLAKGIASGVPMGAVLMTEEVSAEIKNGDLGSTFGGGMIAAAALEATVEAIVEDRLLERVRDNSDYMIRELGYNRSVQEVRGLGYLVGVKFKNGNAKQFQQGLLDRKIIAGLSEDPAVLRLLPPLTLGRFEIDSVLEALEDCSRAAAKLG